MDDPTRYLSGLFSQGFAILPSVITQQQIRNISGSQIFDGVGAGSRLGLRDANIRNIADSLTRHQELEPHLARHTCVSCHVFDKQGSSNWGVPFHRDTQFPFEERVSSGACRDWEIKEVVWYARLDRGILRSMLAIRISIDDHGVDNGALRVVPGSHDAECTDAEIVAKAQTILVPKGSALVMRPLLLHASDRMKNPLARRRTLHFAFGPSSLPDELRWKSWT